MFAAILAVDGLCASLEKSPEKPQEPTVINDTSPKAMKGNVSLPGSDEMSSDGKDGDLSPEQVKEEAQRALKEFVLSMREEALRKKKKNDSFESEDDGAAEEDLISARPERELPSMSQLFAGEIPAEMQIVMAGLKPEGTACLQKFNAMLDKGLLLYGPPGTGKTTIGEQLARETDRAFFYRNAGSFKTSMQASTSTNIQNLFKDAEKVSRTRGVIVFIDEIEALTKATNEMTHAEDLQGLKTLLTEIDRFRGHPRIFIIAATNYLHLLEGASVSRFFCLEVKLPKIKARKQIIQYYLNKFGVETNSASKSEFKCSYLDQLARVTDGFSGRDLELMVLMAVQGYSLGISPKKRSMFGLWCNFVSRPASSMAHLPNALWSLIGSSGTDLDRRLFSLYVSLREKKDNAAKKVGPNKGLEDERDYIFTGLGRGEETHSLPTKLVNKFGFGFERHITYNVLGAATLVLMGYLAQKELESLDERGYLHGGPFLDNISHMLRWCGVLHKGPVRNRERRGSF